MTISSALFGFCSSRCVLFVADLLEPLDHLAVQRLLDRNVSHRCAGTCPVPVFLVGRAHDHVPGPDLHGRLTPALREATPSSDDQSLTERMRMPRGACPWLKRDTRAGDATGLMRLKQGIDAHGGAEVFGRTLA